MLFKLPTKYIPCTSTVSAENCYYEMSLSPVGLCIFNGLQPHKNINTCGKILCNALVNFKIDMPTTFYS